MGANIKEQLNTLNRLYKESADVYSIAYQKLNLSESAFWILYVVSHERGEYTQMDLCNNYFYPIQTINSAITKLCKEGLIRLEVIPKTKNKKKIVLTEAGLEFCQKNINLVDEIETSALETLTSEEREQYLYLMNKHISTLREKLNKVFLDR